ncbi:MAG: T9SS type A sorting domain-containing protein [Bacteroidales bacterium]|nr:T9SS type A sorting domain-containing protein [Bacteroidales bacterium]
MKKTLPLFYMMLLTNQLLFSQSVELSPTVISSAGNYSEAEGVSLSWTLGEIAVSSLQSDNYLLAQGFQQSYPDNTGFVTDPIRWQIAIYPNPVKRLLRLQFDVPEPTDFMVEVQDVSGKLLLQKQYKQVFPGDVIPFDMSDYNYGVYFFRISTTDRKQTRVLSITKI